MSIRPPMNDVVKVSTRELDEHGEPILDRFGRPQMTVTESRARVSYEIQTVYTTDGVAHNAVAEVNLPPDVPVEKGSDVTYKDTSGNDVTRQVLSLGSSMNYSGRTVYFRTVHLG